MGECKTINIYVRVQKKSDFLRERIAAGQGRSRKADFRFFATHRKLLTAFHLQVGLGTQEAQMLPEERERLEVWDKIDVKKNAYKRDIDEMSRVVVESSE